MKTIKLFTIATLKGIGQIMLQENSITGLFFLAGILLGSIEMGVAVILATASGTATALLFKFDKNKVEQGIYGFSAALLGVALLLFFKSTPTIWLLVLVGGVLTSLLQHYFLKKNLPVFTFPFVLVTWVFILFIYNFYPHFKADISNNYLQDHLQYLFPLRGVGQVIFQSSWISGLLFLIGIAINSRITALFAIVASIVAGFFAWIIAVPFEPIAMGLLSYNAVLSSIAFVGLSRKKIVLNLLIVLFTVTISALMFNTNIIQLTFPFVLVSFIGKMNERKFQN